MKLSKIVITVLAFCLTILLFGFLILPYLVVQTNQYFSLPVVNYFVLKILGFMFVFMGSFLVVYCTIVFNFKKAGSPFPLLPPDRLIVADIYSYSRNPMYLAYWLVISGEFFIFGHILILVYLSLIILVTHLYIVYYEENRLKRMFGEEYKKYMEKVPRYLFL